MSDFQQIDVPIGFIIKVHDTNLDSFKKDIGQEVYIIGGDHKGYRAMLYSFSSMDCTIALHGQQCTKIQLKDIATSYRMRLNSAMLEGPNMLLFLSSSISTWTTWSANSEDLDMTDNPASTHNLNTAQLSPWTVNIHDMLEARMEKPKEISPSFMEGRLHNQFMSMACPDPFLGLNGPTPEGYVAIFCSSNTAGTVIQHYHISAMDLSPAPHTKKSTVYGSRWKLLWFYLQCNQVFPQEEHGEYRHYSIGIYQFVL
ncbi:hypothetical protein BDR06DRAFT_969490 [Suillus hirtellus]|nr:hypothetical protein BDR06DRAFT_969490 [Suillus hirtellus]